MATDARAGGAAAGGVACALSLAVFATMLFGNLSHPLLWQDEAETAMFGRRVLEYGYPKVHGPRNVVYQFGFDAAMGVKEPYDAYIGTTWGHFYLATIGLALAERSEDVYDKTLRLRLPFALAGAAGVLVLLVALLPSLSGARSRLAFASAYLLSTSACVALLLHLREVRYYPLVTLLASALCAVHVLHWVYRRISYRSYAVATALLLFLLYQTFFVGCFVFLVALAGDRLLALRELPRDADSQRRALLRFAAPLVAAVLMIVPFLIFFETFSTARAFAKHLGLTPAGYLRNLAAIAGYLVRFEFLLPALAVGAARFLLSRGAAPAESVPDGGAAAVSRLLALVVLANALVNAANPLLYGRYFEVLSPHLTALFLLETVRLARLVRGRAGSPRLRRREVAALALSFLALLVALIPKLPDVAGRVAELRDPVRGPLDFAIPFLEEHYGDTRELVIATNYEAYPLMLYLDSQVIVGLSGADPKWALEKRPDVVIPRKSWPRHLDLLAGLLRQGHFERHDFPVRDDPYNTIPELGRWPSVPVPHRFETEWARSEREGLQIFLRVDD
jgi:hypothetical protein